MDRKKRSRLADQWDKVLVSLSEYGFSVIFDEDTYPLELRNPYFDDEPGNHSVVRRPRGYWKQLMKAIVEINPPEDNVRLLKELRR